MTARSPRPGAALALLISVFTATGCGDTTAYRVPDIIRDRNDTVGFDARAKNMNPWVYCLADEFRRGDQRLEIDAAAAGDDDWLHTRLALFASDPARAAADRRVARDLLQTRIMALSDQVSGEYLAKVARNEDLVNVGLGSSALLFDALGTALTGVDASRAMSAASGFATASRELVNEEVYQNAFGPAIIKTIATARQKRALELQLKRRDFDIDAYPVGDAIADAIAYHEMASFFSGLMAVQTDVYRGQARLSNETRTLQDEADGPAAKAARDAALIVPP